MTINAGLKVVYNLGHMLQCIDLGHIGPGFNEHKVSIIIFLGGIS